MPSDSAVLPVRLANGVILQAEVVGADLGHEGDVAAGLNSFAPKSLDDVISAIEGIAASVGDAFKRVQPDEAVVEFGIELVAEAGNLTALLVKGGGKASLAITLKWVAGGASAKLGPS